MEENLNLEAAAKRIAVHGPDRIVVKDNGYAVRMWDKEAKFQPDIIFVRNDGWSLGAPRQFESVAYLAWQDEWAAFTRRPDIELTPISEYEHKTNT